MRLGLDAAASTGARSPHHLFDPAGARLSRCR